MNHVEVKITIPQELFAHLSRARQLDNLRAGIQDAGQYLVMMAAVYPPESHRPQGFTSDRQRRAFFAKLRAGEITVPYQRTNTLMGGWQLQTWPGGLGITAGNNTAYSHLVQGAQQATYHRVTGWKTVMQIGQGESQAVFNIISTAAARDFA